MTVINIEKSKDKLFKKDEFRNFVIQAQQLSDLKYTIDLILDFNEKLKQIWFKKYKKWVSYF